MARRARDQRDSVGAHDSRIVVTGDLDEYGIAALAAAPVDGYGVGTSLVTGSGAPTASLVYKLVARADGPDEGAPLRPVAKRSTGKPSRGGRKTAVRRVDGHGVAYAETVSTGPWAPGPRDRVLQVPLLRDGEVVGRESLQDARDRHARSVSELPPTAVQLSKGEPAVPTEFVNGGPRP